METPRQMLRRHEGLRLKPYRCTQNKLTIGYGHNLDAKGITIPVAELMFEEDYLEAEAGAKTLVSNFAQLSENRQGVLVNMVFQMGVEGLRKWVNTLLFIEAGDFALAASNMRRSLWYRQTPNRAKELIRIMEEG